MKRTLLFALLVLAYQLGMAQNITSFSFSNNIRNVIVRQQTNDHEVIYLESGNNHYLTYMNDPTSVRKLVIPNELEFHDMVIYNEYAYFCGTNTAIRKGIVGYFHIDSLFRGISNIYFYSNFQLNTSYVTSLDALTVYRGGLRQQLCIAAVGATSNKKACAMEIVKTLPHWRYTIGESTDASESITNICHTDQYVVTAGTIHNNVDGINFRIYTKGMMFASSGIQNNNHQYTSNGNSLNIEYPLAKFKMTTIDSNRVAVLSQWTTYGYPNELSRGILTLVIDPYLTISTTGCNQIYSTLTNLEDATTNRSIDGLSFDGQNNGLHFLLRSNSPWGNQSIYGTMSLPPTTYMPVGYYQGYNYTAMDKLQNLSYMTLVGNLQSHPHKLIFSKRYLPLNTQCSNTETLTNILDYTFSKKTGRVEFNTYVQTFNFYEAEVISHTSSLGNTECW